MANPFSKSYSTQNLSEEVKKNYFNIFAETKDTDGNIIETWTNFDYKKFTKLKKHFYDVKKQGVNQKKVLDQQMAVAKAIVYYDSEKVKLPPINRKRSKHWSVQAIMERLYDWKANEGDNEDDELTYEATFGEILAKGYKTQLKHAHYLEEHANIWLDIQVLEFLGLPMDDGEQGKTSLFDRILVDEPIKNTLAYWAKNKTASRLKDQHEESCK